MDKISRASIIGAMAVIMLALFMTTGFFSIPIGVSICSVIGIIYGYKCKDKSFFRWSMLALVIGVAFIIYVVILIKSMQ